MEQTKKTASYRVVADSGGSRVFRFYCDISGELCCVTRPIQADIRRWRRPQHGLSRRARRSWAS